MHMLDNVREKPESEVQAEQAQAEETNTKLNQVKPSFTFLLITILILGLIVH
jgi:hypothetical protein